MNDETRGLYGLALGALFGIAVTLVGGALLWSALT